MNDVVARARRIPRALYLLLATVPLLAVHACENAPMSVLPESVPVLPESVPALSVDGGGAAALGVPAVVISQVYGGGGNSGAQYTNDFVELFNRSGEAVSMGGWRIHYASANGNTWSNTTTLVSDAIIQPGAYYLVQLSGGTNGVALPNPDATGTINMSASAGKVYLTTAAVTLTGECPDDASLVDRVSFGSTNCQTVWPGVTTNLSNTTAALRNDEGCAYTGAAGADFSRLAPAPRNSSSPAVDCGSTTEPGEAAVVNVTPATTSVAAGSTVQFSAGAVDDEGHATATTFTWTSSDEGIATVDVANGLATAVAAGTVTITATAANGVSGSAELTVIVAAVGDVVISQVYGGGGNSGATYTHDFVELLNRGDEPVNLAGWSVQYTSAAGATWSNLTELSGTIQPGGYFLVQQAAGAGGTTALPAPDVTGTIAMAATNGKVALVSSTTALSGACPLGGGVMDFVGFGSANCYEGTGATPVLNNTTAALRLMDGCQDTDDNAADFTTGAPAPRNSASPAKSCAPPPPPPPVTPTGLVITEFLSDPDGADGLGEWFEMYNAGDTDIDLLGWHLRSRSSSGIEAHTIASIVIVPAGGFVVLGNNADVATNGGVNVDYSYGGDIILNNSNTDWLTVKRPDGTLEDSVAYSARVDDGTVDGVITSPQFFPAEATSRVLIDINFDNSVAGSSNWRNSTTPLGDGRNLGSPGYGAYGVAGPVVSVVISPSPAAVLPGGSVTFSSLALDALGRISTEPLSWLSSDPAIASIHPTSGVATGHAGGHVTITATSSSGVSATTTLSVVGPDEPATVQLTLAGQSWMPVGYEKRVFVTVRNLAGDVIPFEQVNPTLTWSVSDPALAELVVYDDRMYVHTLGAGTVRVLASTPNGVTGASPNIDVLPADAPTSSVYRNHVEFGTPTAGDASDDILVVKREFVSSYSQTRGAPNWVSWNLNASTFGSSPRCDCFSSDRSLPDGVVRVVDSDYIGSGYDRGHMVQSESRTQTQQENAATFLFTNILPQAPANNQQSWLGFENHLNGLARQDGREIYVIAGGEYSASPQTLNNAGKVQIPEFTWKVAVVMEAGHGLADVQTPGDMQVIAIRMPNLISTATSGSWENFATTVDAIEEATGYDFLTELPEWIERIVESGTRPPVAVAGGPYSGFRNIGLTFDGTGSSDPDEGDVLSFAWDFGDGSTGTGVAPTHSYASLGEFTVRLIVSDQYGAADTTYTTATIAQGLVTGGGTINVPAGALASNPNAAGRANLSFNARATDTGFSGELQLNLNQAGFRFTGLSVTALAVTGDAATMLGTGRIGNGGPVYTYSLAVRDSNGGDGAARIVIRDAAGAIVFDNLPGAEADALAPVTGSVQVW